MKAKSKYGNTRVTCDRMTGFPSRPDRLTGEVLHFDSQLELFVYQCLIKDIHWKNISREPAIEISGKCSLHPRGIKYLPDFGCSVIRDEKRATVYHPIDLYIECKGQPTSEWKQKMRQLETSNFDAYQRIVIVTNNQAAMPKNMVSIRPDQVRDFIRGVKAHEGSYASFKVNRSQGR